MGGSRSWWVWKGGEGEQAESTTAVCWGFWAAQLWGVQTRPPATTFRSRGASTAPPTQLQPWYISEKATLPWRLQVMESPPRTHTDCLNVYLPAPLKKKNSCCISTARQQSAILPSHPRGQSGFISALLETHRQGRAAPLPAMASWAAEQGMGTLRSRESSHKSKYGNTTFWMQLFMLIFSQDGEAQRYI